MQGRRKFWRLCTSFYFLILIFASSFTPAYQQSTVLYDCDTLGDISLSEANCQACRGLFPSCKRCAIMKAVQVSAFLSILTSLALLT
ncbi:hypothetical protein FGO68_gene15242 [Halteria grandinella]|uniref:Uncharacterized protein n=1 Tax=Halteria grandinella TaxID=5974 RepID=A0A8J8P8U3_HALGN|nr:hypothetical protein FGO68_gene15242 [Halteria grandinella]